MKTKVNEYSSIHQITMVACYTVKLVHILSIITKLHNKNKYMYSLFRNPLFGSEDWYTKKNESGCLYKFLNKYMWLLLK